MKHIKKYIYILPSLCFLGLVFWLCLTNAGVALSYTLQSLPSGYVEYTQNFEKNLSEYLVQKYSFLELNGEMSKILDIETLNGVRQLKNGYLTAGSDEAQEGDIKRQWDQQTVEGLVPVTEYLKSEGIGSLFVPIPLKLQFYDCERIPSYKDRTKEIDLLETIMESHGVPVLNMNTWFRENNWNMEKTYFRTDHHWKPEAAFAAMQQIMERFSKDYGVICNETMDLESWCIETFEDWFVGSHGWRTGIRYGGKDDIAYIYPKFETKTQVGRIDSRRNYLKNMSDSIYNLQWLDQPGSYNESVYCLYVGGDYPLVYAKNSLASNDKKLMVVGDSMRLPVEAFLTTQFTELYHLDLRYYQDGTFLEYVKEIEPDFVVFLFHGASGIYQNYGLGDWERDFAGREPYVIRREDLLELPLAQSNSQYHLWEANMAAGSYQVTLDRASLNRDSNINPEEPGMYLQMSLVNLSTGSIEASRYFLAEYDESQRWLFTIPEDPQANYAIRIYNGKNDDTLGNAAMLTGLTLSQFQ